MPFAFAAIAILVKGQKFPWLIEAAERNLTVLIVKCVSFRGEEVAESEKFEFIVRQMVCLLGSSGILACSTTNIKFCLCDKFSINDKSMI